MGQEQAGSAGICRQAPLAYAGRQMPGANTRCAHRYMSFLPCPTSPPALPPASAALPRGGWTRGWLPGGWPPQTPPAGRPPPLRQTGGGGAMRAVQQLCKANTVKGRRQGHSHGKRHSRHAHPCSQCGKQSCASHPPACVSRGVSEGTSPRAVLTTPAQRNMAGSSRWCRSATGSSASTGSIASQKVRFCAAGKHNIDTCTLPSPPLENWAWFMPGISAKGRMAAKCLRHQ